MQACKYTWSISQPYDDVCASAPQDIPQQADPITFQSAARAPSIADIADLPGSFAEQGDPVNPFTLFGNTRYTVNMYRQPQPCELRLQLLHIIVHVLLCAHSSLTQPTAGTGLSALDAAFVMQKAIHDRDPGGPKSCIQKERIHNQDLC